MKSLICYTSVYFILLVDRDPALFRIILNYLRTRDVDLKNVDIRSLRTEAEFYGITSLAKRLALCEDLSFSTCGDVLFYGYLPPARKILYFFALSRSISITKLNYKFSLQLFLFIVM